MARRVDQHRPAEIQPQDYQFVAFDYIPNEGDVLGAAMFLAEQRKMKRAHMERTGGKYSQHEHGGLCHVCGSTNAIYSATFYHGKSNSYIQTGLDCAQKLECEGIEAFRKSVKKGLEASKGKGKAKAVLDNAGMGAAWAIYENDAANRKAHAAAYKAWEISGETDLDTQPRFQQAGRDESTVIDIVGRLIKWGDISDKAQNFLGVLLERIAKAPEIAAQRAAETEAADPVPVIEGRIAVRGKVLTIRSQESMYGVVTKMLVQAEAGGWKCWGSVPSVILDGLAKGDVVEFSASLKVSDNDPKFGFFSRPSKARVIKEEVAA